MFELVNGWLMLGALGGSIPVIIHLLNRRRFRIVRWAAMEFLLASLKKNFRRVRMENLLLLLLRVLMVVLMALALARPVLPETGVMSALGTEGRHAIIIVDNSLSMRYHDGRGTCFDRAKGVAQQILRSLNKGDVVSVLAMSDLTRSIIGHATLDVELAKNDIGRIAPGWGGTDVREALVAAAGLLGSTEKPRKDIFLITDMQALGWGKKEDETGPELKTALEQIRKKAELFVVDVGSDEPENLAVTDLKPDSRITGTGSRTTFSVKVTNFGRAKKAGIEASFLVNRFNQDMKSIDVGPGETATVSFSHRFRRKGAHVVQVELDDDRLKADNVRHLALYVEESVPVLLVNGETSRERDQDETVYLEFALKPPSPEGSSKLSNIEPTTITEFGLSAIDFEKYRLVALANLASMAAKNAVLRLEDYVKHGGPLLIFLGDRVDAKFYNQALFKGGEGLLPARLGREVGSIGEDKKGFHIELAKPDHPAFQSLTDEMRLLINRFVLFYRYFHLEVPKQAKNVRVIARFDTGSPAIVEKSFGRGKVVLFASSADAEWNNFGPTGALLVAIHELVGHLVAGGFWQHNVTVHQPYRRTFAPEDLVQATAIKPPGETSLAKKLSPFGQPPKIVFTETDAAGLYELELTRKDGTKQPMEYFAVNPPPEESDLTRYTPEQARAAIPAIEFKYATSVDELRLAVRRSRSGRDLARALLLTVLALACVELILGQRFGR